MEETTKKQIYIVIIIVCLVVAAVIFFVNRPNAGSSSSFDTKGQMWLACRNPDCQAEYQMDKKEYFASMKELYTPRAIEAPALVCEKCSEESVYRALKCPKCESVFEAGVAEDIQFEDRCPKCDFSQKEADREAALEKRRNR